MSTLEVEQGARDTGREAVAAIMEKRPPVFGGR